MLKQLLIIFGALLLSAATWVWVQAIVVPHQVRESAKRDEPRGNLSDLYPRWVGARELLLHHRDPYRADIAREIQIGYYGRPLDPTRPNDPKDQQGFAYPIYVVLLLAPTVTWSFATVHRIFFWLLASLTMVSVLLWLRTLRWRIPGFAVGAWILLTLSCFPSIQGLKLQQLSLLVAALIAGSMCALVRGHYVGAGILLALATIKPQLVFLLVLWLCTWVMGNWRERNRLAWSFVVSMFTLTVAGEFLLPGWITEFRVAMKDYYRYTGGGNSILDVLLTPMWGRITSVLLVGIGLVLIWKNRRASQETGAFEWSLCFTLATTLLVIPTFALYNQLLLLPGLMMTMRVRRELWQESRFLRFFCSITALSVGWPYLCAASLVAALSFLSGSAVDKGWALPLYPSFAIPITVYALLLVSSNVMTEKAQRRSRERNLLEASIPAPQ
jgi:Glycosyltransferase family 87